MAGWDLCSACSETPQFICLCSNLAFCGGDCFATHLLQQSDTVHSTLPISQQEALQSFEAESIIQRDAAVETLKGQVNLSIEQVDAFKQASLSKITERGELIKSAISKVADETSEAIRLACEQSQGELQKLLDDLETPRKEGEANRSYILIDNILRKNLPLSELVLAKYSLQLEDLTSTLKSFATCSVTFPAKELGSLLTEDVAPNKFVRQIDDSADLAEQDQALEGLHIFDVEEIW